MQAPYQILLYYKFVHIEDPQAFAAEHLEWCRSLGLRGRILVAEEGLNGTVSGTVEATEAYMNGMRQDPRFADMVFKVDPSEGHVFKRLSVKPRKEIITMRLDPVPDPTRVTGKRLSPAEFYEALQRDDVIVLDGRNGYEYDIGHFRGAIRPDISSFREFPEWIRKNLSQYKDRTILTYCTGGIRCEKLTAFMIEEGFKDVAQLDGGIVTYGKDPQVKGQLWYGKCYVFDERISVRINQVEDVIVGRCHHCGRPEDRYINCAYQPCHAQFICCPDCEQEHRGFCSTQCREAVEQIV